MADEDFEVKPYKLTTDDGEVWETSKGFNDNGVAEYPSGDTYTGPFTDGVSFKN
jgi:hypothetical protein